MRLSIPVLYGAAETEDGSLSIQPTHTASWHSREPSTSTAGSSRRVAFACADNTIWITSLSGAAASGGPVSPDIGTDSVPQIVIPPTRAPSGGSRTPTASRLSRPVVPRSSSFAGRHRATSSASSILSSSSRRRSSALSPPPIASPIASVSTTTALADPHAGHDHRTSLSDRTDLLGHLREQKASGVTQDDGRLGLGIAGLGRRGLPGVHSKEDIAEHSGAVSPKSAKSAESGRTISTRLMGWMGADENTEEKDRNELMERVAEVEVEREMIREVEEDKREAEDEKIIQEARRTPLRTPRLSSGPEDGTRRTGRVTRIVLRETARGKVVQLKVDEDLGVLLVLRDIGLLDVISLVTLEVTDAIDVEAPEVSTKQKFRLPPFWHWQGINILQHDNESLILIHGLPWPCGLPSPNGEVTHVVTLRPSRTGILEVVSRLDLPGLGDIGATSNAAGSFILRSTPTAITSYPITSPAALASAPLTSSAQLRNPQPRSVSAATPGTSSRPSTPAPGSLLPPGDAQQLRKVKSTVQLRDAADQPSVHPTESKTEERSLAKFLAQRRVGKEEKLSTPDLAVGWGIGEGRELEVAGGSGWSKVDVLTSGLGTFLYDGQTIRIDQHIDNPKTGPIVQAALLAEDVLMLRNETTTLLYRCSERDSSPQSSNWEQAHQLDSKRIVCSAGSGALLCADAEGADLLILGRDGSVDKQRVHSFQQPSTSAISAITPHNLDSCFVADPAGNVTKRRLLHVLDGKSTAGTDSLSADRLDSRITCLKLIQSDPPYLVAGDEDGAIRIWDAETFELQGSWTLFAFPVHTITLLADPKYGSLGGCVMCTSQAGTVGLISLAEMEQLFLIPASRVPLRRVYIGGKDVMLAYANGKARVWNYETQEFRRSTGLDAAEDMLNSGEWAMVDLDALSTARDGLSAAKTTLPVESDLGRLLEVDVRALCTTLQSSRNTMSTSPLATLRTILSILIPFGVDAEMDRICQEGLGINPPSDRVAFGITSPTGSYSIPDADKAEVWRISAESTGKLQLAIVTLLRPFLDSLDHERSAAQLIAYFTASLPEGSIPAGLPFFAAFYLDYIADIHQAARMLFGSQMDGMAEADFEAVVDAHLPELPSFLPSADQHLKAADLALTMLGGMALHKYQSMTPAALKAIAESITIYLNSTIPSHLSLAIELASKGFTTWQAFVDPAEMLRRLFLLSTSNPSTSTSQGSQISAQARLAVLHVASSNPALFMSTLSMDILDAKSVEGRKSIMKLCVYMARKRPQVLENSLPKVVEAVVKSLDPNVGKMREDVQQTATVILNELVLAFSTVDFHSSTQKLAVGTHEGALIMYDLKTASRLYILEPHKHPVSAVNFSPDGRRLITVSLEEGGLTVWKIGSSLSGFFNVGGPPRQGAVKAGEPFKRIEFARADNVPLDSTSALSDVQISWPGMRQAKVLIKETAMTFET
ncbi:uncharacterized protein MKK02DRAFT_40384 [Dioszegia hungarica]|uniref:WD40 repeat-like protein n=1 Tax=Dioszegia hungarica TaxID=4972 RepID=A0AA38H5U7_9TREE|nr:uncharacterized protein MKK02DRAFT_40384 [Dioszegia hungarica]KAI9633004.1 hypothetical protein MKK02DRAFT_40384 [Dioszegia hungarica]